MTHMQAVSIAGGIYLVCTPLILLYLRREYRERGKLGWIGSILHFLLYAPHAMFSCVLAWGTEGIAPLGSLAWIGLPLMILGLGVTIYAMDLFQVFSRWVGSQTPGLQTGGLYRFSRNPQFVGYGILMLGFMIAWWNSLAWIAFLAYVILVYAVVHVEEEHLTRVYGDAYREYMARVPRFFPWKRSSK